MNQLFRSSLAGTTVVLLLFSIVLSASAQHREDPAAVSRTEGPVAGVVRMKVARNFTTPIDLERIKTDLVEDFGEVSISPWMNPTLLFSTYADHYLFSIGLARILPEEMPVFSIARIMTVEFDATIPPEKMAAALSSRIDVEYAEPVWPIYPAFLPNDPDVVSGKQWHHDVIKTPAAWDIEQGDRSVIIAIVDNGTELTHEDLAPQIWYNPGEADELADNGVDDDQNGLIDDWRGYDFSGTDGRSEDNNPSPGFDFHGTHVAGIAAATGGNGQGGAGVSLDSRIMAIKVAGDAKGLSYGTAYEGLLYAGVMGADVINCSWGSDTYSLAEQELVSYVRNDLGAIIIAAAGNNGNEAPYFPASYDHTISVGSTRPDDRKAATSNYHHTVDLSAPGEGVWSTKTGNTYGVESGTSMSAPMVAGGAALLLSADDQLTAEQVEVALIASTNNNDILLGQAAGLLGSGRLNVAQSLQRYKTLKAGRVIGIDIVDQNGNGILDQGESARLAVTVRNVLAPTDRMSLTVEPIGLQQVTTSENFYEFGSMATGETALSGDGSLLIKVAEDATADSKARFWLTLSTDDYSERVYLEFDLFPTWGTTDLNNIRASFTGDGRIGYTGLTSTKKGDGFYYNGSGSLLWHGGLLLGSSRENLADVVRKGSVGSGTNNGFAMEDPYRVTSSDNGIESAYALFSTTTELAVSIYMETFEFAENPDAVLLKYSIDNLSDENLNGLYCGLYLDWDIRTNGQLDQALLDESLDLGFVRNSVATEILAGAALVSDHTLNYRAIDNVADGVQTDFSREKKWSWLSGGIERESTPVDVDAGMMISAGPFTIPARSREHVGFLLVAGEDFASLQAAVEKGRVSFGELLSVATEKKFAMSTVSPQPSRGVSTVSFDQPLTAGTSYRLFDATGNEQYDWKVRESSSRSVSIDLSRLPAGHYTLVTETDGVFSVARILLRK